MDQKYSADSGPHADSHATRASLMPNCVDCLFTSDPVISLTNKSNLRNFYAHYATHEKRHAVALVSGFT